MIKALENPHYKKILEYVNWQGRHPEAKSLEEALKLERKYFDCMFIYNNIYSYVGEDMKNLRLHKEAYDAMINEELQDLSFLKKIKLCKSITGVETLGRAITLEDVMMILPKTFAYWNAYNSIVDIQFSNGHHVIGFNLQWLPSKLLHEQSEDTWVELFKRIKTREHVLTVEEVPSQTHGIN